jgi:hypothetical protein
MIPSVRFIDSEGLHQSHLFYASIPVFDSFGGLMEPGLPLRVRR